MYTVKWISKHQSKPENHNSGATEWTAYRRAAALELSPSTAWHYIIALSLTAIWCADGHADVWITLAFSARHIISQARGLGNWFFSISLSPIPTPRPEFWEAAAALSSESPNTSPGNPPKRNSFPAVLSQARSIYVIIKFISLNTDDHKDTMRFPRMHLATLHSPAYTDQLSSSQRKEVNSVN